MAGAKTPEQIAEEEARKKRLAEDIQQAVATGDLMELLKGLLGWLFDFIVGDDSDNPGEDDERNAPDLTTRLRSARAVLDAGAVEKWNAFKATHTSARVLHAAPVAGAAQVTSDFGHRETPKAGASHDHKGLDFGARDKDRTPDVLASADGVVLFVGRKGGYGNVVMLGHADGTITLYGHMTGDNSPAIGSTVAQGQVIGEMGNTGNSTGTHLHYEQWNADRVKVNPMIAGRVLAHGENIHGGERHTEMVAVTEPSPATAKPLKTNVIKPPKHIPQHVLAAATSSGNGRFEVSDITETAHHAKVAAVAFVGKIKVAAGNFFQV